MMFKQNLKMKKLLYSSLVLSTIVVYSGDQFSTLSPQPAIQKQSTSNMTILNQTYVTLDLSVLHDKNSFTDQDSVVLHLDSNREIILYVKKISHQKNVDNFTWIGKNDKENINAIFSIRNGKLVGTIQIDTETYKIVPVGDIYKIEKMDTSKIRPFHGDDILETVKEISSRVNTSTTKEINTLEATTSVETSVDVMLLYTAGFQLANGEATVAAVQNLFDIAQNAYTASLTDVNLNLVYVGQVPATSTLNNTSNLYNTLSDLASNGYVQHQRTQYNADIVSLIGQFFLESNNCGLGRKPYTLGSKMTDAFSVTLNGRDSGYYCSDLTLAHEIGHNFACNHDADHAGSTTMYTYGYGYDVASKFATVMSYDNPEIHYFSNPNIIDIPSGLAIGNASNADNARVIRNNKLEMANNSDEVDESLEVGDTKSALEIDAYLSTKIDRDSYVVNLGGPTTFSADNVGYGCWYFYINLYDEEYNLVFSSDANSGSGCDATDQVVLENGTYKMMVFNNGWNAGNNQHYLIGIDTEYVEPIKALSPAIISYILN